MSPEEANVQGRAQQLARMRFSYIFRAAWYSIAKERGYRFDQYLGTSSHWTIAVQHQLRSSGL